MNWTKNEIKTLVCKEYILSNNNPDIGWSDQYGSLYVARKYCTLPQKIFRFNDWWLHGCNGPWENFHKNAYVYDIDNTKIKYLLARKDQEDFFKSEGYTNSIAIGLPIVYVPKLNLSRIKKSLIIYPPHFSTESKIRFESYKKYLESIKNYLEYFKFTYISCHYLLLEDEELMKLFQSFNLKIVEGANPRDRNALLRQKMILSQFEYMTTPSWGSHVAYALAFGCKVSLFGKEIGLSKESLAKMQGWKSRLDILDIYFSDTVINERRSFLKKFYCEPTFGIKDIELGEWLIGKQHKKSSKELKRIFNWNIKTIFNHAKLYF